MCGGRLEGLLSHCIQCERRSVVIVGADSMSYLFCSRACAKNVGELVVDLSGMETNGSILDISWSSEWPSVAAHLLIMSELSTVLHLVPGLNLRRCADGFFENQSSPVLPGLPQRILPLFQNHLFVSAKAECLVKNLVLVRRSDGSGGGSFDDGAGTDWLVHLLLAFHRRYP